MSIGYSWRKMVLAIIFWFKVDYYYCLVYYLICKYWFRSSAFFNRTNIMHMPTSVSVFCIIFKILALFIITWFVQLYLRVGILLTYRKHLDGRIISLRGEVLAHQISLTPSPSIEVPVPSQDERSLIFVLGYRFCLFFYWILEMFRQ